MHFFRHRDHLHLHLPHVRTLPFVRRLVNPHVLRRLIGLSVGALLCCVGSSISVFHWLPVHHLFADVVAYGIHGIGLIPFAQHAEPLFRLLTAD